MGASGWPATACSAAACCGCSPSSSALLLFLALLLGGLRRALLLVLLALFLVGRGGGAGCVRLDRRRRWRAAGRAGADRSGLGIRQRTAVDADAGDRPGRFLSVRVVLEEPEGVGDDRQGFGGG